tara:strand:- start:205 stop:891 length:687 start_codon:yes stop_codon:yes gene_type:complete
MKKILLFIIFSLLGLTNTQAIDVEPYSFNNENLLLPIPNGFCNATEELTGIFILEYLNMQFSNQPDSIDSVKPVIVFTRCGFENNFDELYPWGYIGLQDNLKPVISQNTLNQSLELILGSPEMMQEIQELVNNTTSTTMNEFGLEFEDFDFNKSLLGWIDENVAIVTTTAQFELEGELLNEIVFQASSVVNNSIVNYYINDELIQSKNPLENSKLLIDNSKFLVEINR